MLDYPKVRNYPKMLDSPEMLNYPQMLDHAKMLVYPKMQDIPICPIVKDAGFCKDVKLTQHASQSKGSGLSQ